MSKHLKDHNPFVQYVVDLRTSTDLIIQNFEGSDNRISVHRVHKQINVFIKDYVTRRYEYMFERKRIIV